VAIVGSAGGIAAWRIRRARTDTRLRQCSPWSDLAWRYPGADLDLILVLREGDAY
jgi:hypothetical protein